jgi:hypothetical protein
MSHSNFKSEPVMVKKSQKEDFVMAQIHKRFTAEQVKILFQGYIEGNLGRKAAEEMLGVSKTRFFALLKRYREDPETFHIDYQRTNKGRLSTEAESRIERALLRERELIEDRQLPIHDYNYTAMRDRLKKEGIEVSTTTITNRARTLGCYKLRKKKKVHDRQVVTHSIGEMIQHDASLHKWSPFADEKWTLITSIDDYSRMLLYADFVYTENSWVHIQSAQQVIQSFGIPFRYYVDNLRVFRFVQKRDSFWRNHVVGTDEVDPQWRQVMRRMNVDVVYALSPQAKGKVERPYRWLQDRIVRTCALEKLTTLDEARSVLREEVQRYNFHQVHSTTGEIPGIRFDQAKKNRASLFRPFELPRPFTSIKDVFCLTATRTTDGYRRISIDNNSIQVSKVDVREDVELHLVPDVAKQVMEIRIWAAGKLVQSVNFPLMNFRWKF